jgi:hypothetical protein
MRRTRGRARPLAPPQEPIENTPLPSGGRAACLFPFEVGQFLLVKDCLTLSRLDIVPVLCLFGIQRLKRDAVSTRDEPSHFRCPPTVDPMVGTRSDHCGPFVAREADGLRHRAVDLPDNLTQRRRTLA